MPQSPALGIFQSSHSEKLLPWVFQIPLPPSEFYAVWIHQFIDIPLYVTQNLLISSDNISWSVSTVKQVYLCSFQICHGKSSDETHNEAPKHGGEEGQEGYLDR